MVTEERVSYHGTLVLHALAIGGRYGFEVMEATDLASGTVYPLLRRFEARGLVESFWEDESAAEADGRPPRRYYLVSASGRRVLGRSREYFRSYQEFLDRPVPEEG